MMEKDENAQTTADVIVHELTDEKNDLTFVTEYLKVGFLSSAVDALFYARREAGLTQEQVAQKLGKKQEAIARWEADTDGKMSLRQYVELALACGRIPLNMMLEPVESIRDFVIENPEVSETPNLYFEWLKKKSEPEPISYRTLVGAYTTQSVATAIPVVTVSKLNQEITPTANTAERFLKEQYQKQLNQASVQSHGESIMSTASASQTPTPVHSAPSQGQGVAA